jgi:hypothetical protein
MCGHVNCPRRSALQRVARRGVEHALHQRRARFTFGARDPHRPGGQLRLAVDIDWFSLRVVRRCGAGNRLTLEQLCRHMTRPALANERMQCNAYAQVELKLKTPWRDGTTHLVMSALELTQRLAAPVPLPRLHVIPSTPDPFPLRASAQRQVSRSGGVPRA